MAASPATAAANHAFEVKSPVHSATRTRATDRPGARKTATTTLAVSRMQSEFGSNLELVYQGLGYVFLTVGIVKILYGVIFPPSPASPAAKKSK
jgi:hypothetical protein